MKLEIKDTKPPKQLGARFKQRYDEAVRQGFTPLGWLKITLLQPMILACFRDDSLNTSLALVGSDEGGALELQAVDLVTHLATNRKLTTTTFAMVNPQERRGIYKYSHPRASLSELAGHHQKQIKKLGGGCSLPIRGLADFKRSIRDYFDYEQADQSRDQVGEVVAAVARGPREGKALIAIRKQARRWAHPDRIKKLQAELASLGFRDATPVTVSALSTWPTVALLHPAKQTYCVLYDDAQSTWVDFFSVRAVDQVQHHCATNANAPLLGLVAQRPAYFASVPYADLDVITLFREFLRSRPRGKWDPVSFLKLPAAFRFVCNADTVWQLKHVEGKPDGDDAMHKVVAASYERARALVEQDELHALRRLLKRLALTKDTNPPLPSTLTAAAGSGSLDFVKLFLKEGANIEEKTYSGTPLTSAASSGHIEVVRFLLGRGARGSIPADLLGGPITRAAGHGHLEVVRELLPLATAVEKANALAAAQNAGHAELVSLLGGKPNAKLSAGKNRKGSLADFFSSMKDSSLLMGCAPEDPPLLGKERNAGVAKASHLLRSRTLRGRLTERVEGDCDTVVLVVRTGEVSLVQAVLEQVQDSDGLASMLGAAAGNGHLEICKMLLKAGADPKNQAGGAIISAARWGNPEIVKLLLDAGANPRARTEDGESSKTDLSGPFAKRIAALLDAAVAAGPKSTNAAASIKYQKPRKKPPLEGRRGVADFRKFIGHPEWAIGFVESDPAKVVAAFKKIHPKWQHEPNLESRAVKLGWPNITVLCLRGHSWTVWIRSVGWVGMEQITGVSDDAAALSKALPGVRAIAYLSEDTSGCEGYELHMNGKKVEEAMRGDVESFKSALRKKLPGSWDDFPETPFREFGIYVPCCFIEDAGFETQLELHGLPEGSVERLDAFCIE